MLFPALVSIVRPTFSRASPSDRLQIWANCLNPRDLTPYLICVQNRVRNPEKFLRPLQLSATPASIFCDQLILLSLQLSSIADHSVKHMRIRLFVFYGLQSTAK